MYGHDVDDTERTVDVKIDENVTFVGMLFSDDIVKGLHSAGYKRPSPIQLAALPLGRCGLDLVVQAKAGTGKTLVFALLAIETVDVEIKRTQVIILAPTREIAVQIADIIETVSSHVKGIKVRVLIGGTPMETDRSIFKNCQIVVGAPGRIRHLIEKEVFDSKAVRLVVLDEADKLMEDSYIKDVNYIFNNAAESKQMIACSATYTPELIAFVKKYMRRGMHITPSGGTNPILVGLRQFVYITPDHCNTFTRQKYKQEALFRLISTVRFDQCLIFSNYVTRAEALCGMLNKQGWNAKCLTGGQTQENRLAALAQLKEHKVRILVTTDLTARGIDASNVNLVVNVEVPLSPETYLHRIGRAGRFGNKGLAITLLSKGNDQNSFQRLIGRISAEMAVHVVPTNKCVDLWEEDETFDVLKAVFDDGNVGNLEKSTELEDVVEAIDDLTIDDSSGSARSSNTSSDEIQLPTSAGESPIREAPRAPAPWKHKYDQRSSKMPLHNLNAYEAASSRNPRPQNYQVPPHFHGTPWRYGHEHLWRTSHALRFPVPPYASAFSQSALGGRPYHYGQNRDPLNQRVWMERLTAQIDGFVHYAKNFNA